MNKSIFFMLFASTLLTAQQPRQQLFQLEPIEARIVGIRERSPEEYTGLYWLTDRLTEAYQHIGPALLVYAETDPRSIHPLLAYVTVLALHNCILLPVGTRLTHGFSENQAPHIPLISNPWHKDRSLSSWLTRAARNIGAHTYNQYIKICASTAPWLILDRVLPKT